MRIVFVDTYYDQFLKQHYSDHPSLESESYESQRQSLIDARFGTSDFYSKYLNELGCEAIDLIVNCRPLQSAWLNENVSGSSGLTLPVPHRFYRVPVIGNALAGLPGFIDVVLAQIEALKPDILYCQDLNFFPGTVLKQIKPHVRLVVGQIASALPNKSFFEDYDLILTSFPHFVSRIREAGVRSEYFKLGFDQRMATMFGDVPRDIGVSFVGGIGPSHKSAISLLEHLAHHTSIRIFGYGIDSIPADSPIVERHEGEVWGLEMYRLLARSRITINRHIGIAENYANNMRLYEATGMGALLLTEEKDNLRDIFEPGREVETYSDPDQLVEKINTLLRSNRLQEIAAAGQARTLREHSYKERMNELVAILTRYLRA
jgi:hypothetical protein